MTETIRTRLSAVAFKVETTRGVDAFGGTVVGADFVTCEAFFRILQDQTPNAVVTGALDDLPPIPGGLRAEVTVSLQMVGGGTPNAAPEWGKLLRACRMVEDVTGPAGAATAPTAATGGTASTITMQSPWQAGLQQYRGMPVLLTGNPAAAPPDVVLNYTTGRVATLARSYSPNLSSGTTAAIAQNVLYRPTSDETLMASLSCYGFVDGLRHRIVGLSGSWAVGLRSGQPATLNFRFTGMVAGYKEAVALPTSYVPVTRQPPKWLAGMSQLDRTLAQCQSAGWDMGVRTAYIDNPEAAQGYDAPVITGATPRITLDPLMHTTHTPARATAYTAGTPVPYACIWGSTAGNRFALSTPSAQIVDLQDSERTEFGVDAIALQPDQPNATIFLACF